MRYRSLKGEAPSADFREATLAGQAPDGGLYFPMHIPAWHPSLTDREKPMDRHEAAFRIMRPYVGETIPERELQDILTDTLSFDIPLVRIDARVSVLELYHGPTLAFKDVGARFMSRCLGHFSKGMRERVVVLVATSGDTGGAVAQGFDGVEGVEVVILYPSGKVSPVQEKQLTTAGANVHALEVRGDFDDCQRLVKKAFTDSELRSRLFMTSANSINVARWLPQQLYYLDAWRQWTETSPPMVSVPSGNFGNLCAGMLAWKSGLPVQRFIAACNLNDTVPRFMREGRYTPLPAKSTVSNAMDVSDPSNFIRILEFFGGEPQELHGIMEAVSIDEAETFEALSHVWREHGYLMDPHGAVGYAALMRRLLSNPGEKGLFLLTAHPVKFPECVEKATGMEIELPAHLRSLMGRPKKAHAMLPEYEELRDFLQHLI
jgi:threonine synthase